MITRITPFCKRRKTANAKRPSSVFAQGDVSVLARAPNLVRDSKDFLDFLRSEVVALNVFDVVIIPIEAGNDHIAIVADCIYKRILSRRDGERAELPEVVFGFGAALVTVEHMDYSQPFHFGRRQCADRDV